MGLQNITKVVIATGGHKDLFFFFFFFFFTKVGHYYILKGTWLPFPEPACSEPLLVKVTGGAQPNP